MWDLTFNETMLQRSGEYSFPGNHIIVNCRTEEDACEFFSILANHGYKWGSGRPLDDDKTMFSGSETCYHLYPDKDIAYSDNMIFYNKWEYDGMIKCVFEGSNGSKCSFVQDESEISGLFER